VQEGARIVYTAGRQMIYTAIGLFAGVEALDSWRRHEDGLARGLGATAVVCGLLLVLSSVFSKPSRR
jgi:hypothetical protein